jgi:hypothetical protein
MSKYHRNRNLYETAQEMRAGLGISAQSSSLRRLSIPSPNQETIVGFFCIAFG